MLTKPNVVHSSYLKMKLLVKCHFEVKQGLQELIIWVQRLLNSMRWETLWLSFAPSAFLTRASWRKQTFDLTLFHNCSSNIRQCDWQSLFCGCCGRRASQTEMDGCHNTALLWPWQNGLHCSSTKLLSSLYSPLHRAGTTSFRKNQSKHRTSIIRQRTDFVNRAENIQCGSSRE